MKNIRLFSVFTLNINNWFGFFFKQFKQKYFFFITFGQYTIDFKIKLNLLTIFKIKQKLFSGANKTTLKENCISFFFNVNQKL